MEPENSKLFCFNDLTSVERRNYIYTLAKIFARRVIIEEIDTFFPNLKGSDIRTNDGIPDNFILSGTGPTSGVIPISWTPDAKYKIIIGKSGIQSFNDQKIWLKIIYDDIFEKDQKDIIDQTIRTLNNNQFIDLKNIALSCLVIPEPQNQAFGFHFYILKELSGWKRIKSYYYSGFSVSDFKIKNPDIKNVTGEEIIKFKNFSSRENGELGESLTDIFARRLIHENKPLFFPDLKENFIKIENEKIRNTSDEYYKIITELQGNNRSGTWDPDIQFHILANSNPFDLMYEIYPKKLVWIEVKTGKNARFERSQELDMEHFSQNLDLFVIYCNVLPDSSNLKLNLCFKRVQKGERWKDLAQHSYTDFLNNS